MYKELWAELNKNYKDSIFYLGIFLLPSAFTVSAILLLTSSIIGFKNNEVNFLKDKINLAFLTSAILMVSSSVLQSIRNVDLGSENWSVSLSWIGLANWLPFFFITWGFQYYLITPKRRFLLAFFLLSGSVPVIITGIGQVFFNLHGPLDVFNGFIIWYSRPLENNVLTGLFNNPNYAGAWLNIIFPISLAFFVKNSNSIKKIISFIFIALIILCIVLTNSRASWIGLICSTTIFLGSKSFKWLFPILSLTFSLILISIFNSQLTLIPLETLNEFTNFQYLDRFDIWRKSIQIIFNNPIYGSGASSFSDLYQSISGISKYHSHNIALELVISYGFPAALCTIIPIIYITFLSLKKTIQKKYSLDFIFDKALITSLIIILMMHMVDIQYFDGRISIIIWLLIAAVRNILKNDLSIKKNF